MALAVAGRALDGRGMRTAVTEALLKATDTEGVGGLVAWAQTADRAAVAALVPAVIEAAAQGDTVARQLIDTASSDLAMLAAGLVRQFGSPAPDRLALSGSLLSPGSPVRAGLAAAISRIVPSLRILDAPIDPALGAARLALRP
jgi:N-acetylglucosamine kinase-like BadF-type ATPase